jgi:hypothetical protein
LNDSLKVQELDGKIAKCAAPVIPAAPSVPVTKPLAPAAPTTVAPKPTPPPPAPKAAPPAPGPKVEPTGYLCPFCDFPLPEKVVKQLKKGFNDECPNCKKVLGKRALEV